MGDSLKATLAALNKRYGRAVVTTGNEVEGARKVPTRVPGFDYVLGGGFAVNRITELYGDFSALKSYMCYVGMGKFQKYDWANNEPEAIVRVELAKKKSGEDFAISKIITRRGYKPVNPPQVKRVALVDIEGTYDKTWGEKLGIDNDLLLYIRPSSLNVAIDIIDALLSDEDVSLVVIDSMIAIGADAEIEASMENEQMGVNARFWNKASRKIQSAMNRNPDNDITVLAINRAYDKVGISFGNPEQLANGKAFALAKSVSVKMTALKEHKGKDESGVEVTLGRMIKVVNKKNKVGRPFLEASFYYSFVDDPASGVNAGQTDVTSQLIELGLRLGMISRKGNYYEYGGKKALGMENFRNTLNEDVDLVNSLYKEVYSEITY